MDFDMIYHANIVATSPEDPSAADRKYFESLPEAQEHMQNLFTEVPKVPHRKGEPIYSTPRV